MTYNYVENVTDLSVLKAKQLYKFFYWRYGRIQTQVFENGIIG
jgi:hypothetical protein